MHRSDELSFPEIREAVRALCARFPGEYWRERDRERSYPESFVAALTEAGYLACLIPEEYGGSGLPLAAGAAILEEIQRSGGNAAACHAQMYTMGTLLRHGSEAQKRKWLPRFRDRYPQPLDDGRAARRAFCRARPEDLDQPRRAFRSHAAARPHDAEG